MPNPTPREPWLTHVYYHGSQRDRHGVYLVAETACDCQPCWDSFEVNSAIARGRQTETRYVLLDPTTHAEMLVHVRPESFRPATEEEDGKARSARRRWTQSHAREVITAAVDKGGRYSAEYVQRMREHLDPRDPLRSYGLETADAS